MMSLLWYYNIKKVSLLWYYIIIKRHFNTCIPIIKIIFVEICKTLRAAFACHIKSYKTAYDNSEPLQTKKRNDIFILKPMNIN